MKLVKTDSRFALYHQGFDCYVEFGRCSWNEFNKWTTYCRSHIGGEFVDLGVFSFKAGTPNGKWKSVPRHRNKLGYQGHSSYSQRIYFRGKKYHTLMLMVIPAESNETFYL